MECRFCEIADRGDYEIENNYFYLLVDIFPVSPGHSLVIPKKHIVSFFDLEEKYWRSLHGFLKKSKRFIEQTDWESYYNELSVANKKSRRFIQAVLSNKSIGKKPHAYNIGINDGKAAGRTVHHLHIHIIPRFEGDSDNPVGGVRHIIPKLANYC